MAGYLKNKKTIGAGLGLAAFAAYLYAVPAYEEMQYPDHHIATALNDILEHPDQYSISLNNADVFNQFASFKRLSGHETRVEIYQDIRSILTLSDKLSFKKFTNDVLVGDRKIYTRELHRMVDSVFDLAEKRQEALTKLTQLMVDRGYYTAAREFNKAVTVDKIDCQVAKNSKSDQINKILDCHLDYTTEWTSNFFEKKRNPIVDKDASLITKSSLDFQIAASRDADKARTYHIKLIPAYIRPEEFETTTPVVAERTIPLDDPKAEEIRRTVMPFVEKAFGLK